MKVDKYQKQACYNKMRNEKQHKQHKPGTPMNIMKGNARPEPRNLLYSQLRLLSRISGDLTNHFDLDEIRVTVLCTFVCLGNWDKGK